MSAPTTQSIASRMERAAPGERRTALFQCARDVAELWRMKRLSNRQRNEWATALQLWGERRAKLATFEASAAIIKGMTEKEGDR
jgi:hypothetical protein